jgi:hypothetical protein
MGAGRLWLTRAVFVGAAVYAWARSHAPATVDADASIRLVERATEAGVRFRHGRPTFHASLAHIAPQVPAVGAGVSVVDADGDGWMDLYAVTSQDGAPNALFRNRGDGTFEEIAEAAGAAAPNASGAYAAMGSIWADIDHDGDHDGLVYGWGKQRLLRNEGGARFRDDTDPSGLSGWHNPACALWLDHDRDGDLDLFFGGYYPEDVDLWHPKSTAILHNDGEDANNGGRNRLYQNDGQGRFTEVDVGLEGTRWTYACSAADLDDDGWTDIFLANDWSGEELWRNVNGRFERAAEIGLDRRAKAGMNVSFGDVHNRAEPAVYVTNITAAGWLVQGNNLRISRLATGGGFENVASPPVDACGFAWGADFGDLDNDGFMDLVVTNGFRSANRERDYWYHLARVSAGNTAIVQDAANWTPFEDMSLSGYERSCLFRNQAGAGFVDVAEASGLTDLQDGRSVVMVDLRNRGQLDVVVANQEGELLIYENRSALTSRHWIGLDLRAGPGHSVAYGAAVRVRFNGQQQVQYVTAGGGMSSQTDPRVHLGLGAAARVDEVEIRWPDGQRSRSGPLEADRYHRIDAPSPGGPR